jgi:PAS domain S-box-containing protein
MVDKLNNCIHHLHTANLNEQAASFSEETKSANKFEKGNGLPGRIWQHGAVEIIDFDKKNDAKLFKSKAAKKLHLKTAAGFPILFKNEVIGVLVFISNQQAAQFNITASLLKEAGTLLGNEIIRKKTEVENEELFDSAADIICLASLEGYFLKINKAATEKLGYTEEELLSKPYIEFIHPDDKFDTLEIKTAVSQGRSVSYFENRYLTKSGKTIWLSWTTSPTKGETYHFAVARDITKQKEAEQHLKESLQSLSDLKSALDQSFNMVLTDPEGYIIDVNDATTKLSGYSRAELIGSHTRVNRSGYHPQSFYTQMWDTIKDGKIWRGDIHNKRKDGSFYWVDTIIVPMKNARGEIINYLAIRTDITKRKEDTENLNILNQNLAKKAHELAISNTELEQFAVVASRDLQEPLRMVSSFMSQLKKKYGESLDEKANQYIDFAANGAKDMREIILDLLEFSRVGSDEESIEPFNVNDIIHEVKLMEKRIIEEHQVIIQTELLPNINWFKNSFRKIVMQLVDNAIKYRQVGRTPLINISSIEYQDHWVFAIHDNGIGIEEEYFEKIFIVFQKLHPKENYPGTGMGLSIVKKLVESAGGKIWLNSKLGEGSTFYFSVNKLHVNK